MIELIRKRLNDSLETKRRLLDDMALSESVVQAAQAMVKCYKEYQGWIYFMGNGGSAGDAQHLAAELTGRYYKDRGGLRAQALTTDTSYLTAVGNDYNFEVIYERMLDGFAKPGDVVVGISTSGNSKNIIRGIEVAKSKGAFTVGFTGQKGGRLKEICDICLCVPSTDTPRIQECHILLGHILCELVENEIFPNAPSSH